MRLVIYSVVNVVIKTLQRVDLQSHLFFLLVSQTPARTILEEDSVHDAHVKPPIPSASIRVKSPIHLDDMLRVGFGKQAIKFCFFFKPKMDPSAKASHRLLYSYFS